MLELPMADTEQLSELENMLRRLPESTRAALLKAVTDLFLENAGRYKPSQIKLFDRLFNALIAEIDAEAVAMLSRRLAAIANAPIETIACLALSDDITVAEPVLMRSPCVADSILIEIARKKSQTHLLAIAVRPQLAAPIVDLLIARGDEVTVRYVANNSGAQLSEAGAATLAELARNDDALTELIGKRSDIPPHLRKASVQAGENLFPNAAV